jgi:hypothetical protein
MRQSYSPNDSVRRASFGGAEYVSAWPRWSDLRPLLLRSAGIAGLATTVIAVITTQALQGEGGVRSDPQPQPPIIIGSDASDPIAALIATPEAPIETASIAPQAEALSPATSEAILSDPDLIAPQIFIREALPPVTPMPLVRELEATIVPAPAVDDLPPAPPPPPALVAEPELVAAAPSVIEDLPPVAPLVAAPAQPPASNLVGDGEAEAEAPDIWAADAVECPRDWVAVSGSDDIRGALDGCEMSVALLTPEAPATAHPALADAASEQAEKLAAMPRLPLPRPDPGPNPISQAAVAPSRADWPAEPPPNCAPFHAYWRYADNYKRKEWYCK